MSAFEAFGLAFLSSLLSLYYVDIVTMAKNQHKSNFIISVIVGIVLALVVGFL